MKISLYNNSDPGLPLAILPALEVLLFMPDWEWTLSVQVCWLHWNFEIHIA